jgi:hypothetical protein
MQLKKGQYSNQQISLTKKKKIIYNSGRLREKDIPVPKHVGVLYLLLIVLYDLCFILFY